VIDLWGSIGFLVLSFGSLLFALLYLSMTRWYKTFMGTLIAIHVTGIGILTTYLSLRIWDIDVPGVEWVRLIIFWVLGLAMIAASIGFLQIQFWDKGAKIRERLSNRYDDVTKDPGNGRL
jgi:hypothetical protein